MSTIVDIAKYPLSDKTAADLKNRFTYHAPVPNQLPRYEWLRNTAKVLAEEIVMLTPPSREQALALTHLEAAIFCANAAIARHETPAAIGSTPVDSSSAPIRSIVNRAPDGAAIHADGHGEQGENGGLHVP